jgi:integrase
LIPSPRRPNARRVAAGPAARPHARRGRGGAQRRRLDKLSAWPHAVESIGMPGLHAHDLRHTGNQFASESKAGLKDLMARMGHDSERAAMIYQHKARGADKAITDAIDAHVRDEQDQGDEDDGG